MQLYRMKKYKDKLYQENYEAHSLSTEGKYQVNTKIINNESESILKTSKLPHLKVKL